MSNDMTMGTVRLNRRSEQGVIAGLNGWQLGTVAIGAGLLVLTAVREFSALIWVAGPALLIVLSAIVPVNGMPASRFAFVWASMHARRARGGTQTRFRPERVAPKGTMQLPGRLGNIQLFSDDSGGPTGGFGVVYDPADRTMTLVAEVEVQGFNTREVPERVQIMNGLARVLAGFTQRPGVKRITIQERTSPMSVEPARAHYRQTAAERGLDLSEAVAVNYQTALNQSELFSVAHRNYVAFTFDLRSPDLLRAVGELGGGSAGIMAVARQEKATIQGSLASDQFTIRRWLTVRQWAGLARTAFDPDYLSLLQNNTVDDLGVDLAAIGPMALDEPTGKNHLVQTDSGVHTTLWVHEWPKSDMPIGFVEAIVFARDPSTGRAVSHIFTIVLTPVATRKALKRVRDDKKTWRNNERARAKNNQAGSAAAEADWNALLDQEAAIIAGEGDFRYGAYITVSAPTERELTSAVAGMRNALNRASMEAQILYCQQAEALLVNALPIGKGMR